MAAVRRANNRFSTLRSRIMRRSASGSQAGGDDLLRASRELSTLSVCARQLPSIAARAHRTPHMQYLSLHQGGELG